MLSLYRSNQIKAFIYDDMEEYKEVPIKSYFKSEVAEFYGISVNTLRIWLKKANIHHLMWREKLLNVSQVRLVFKVLGHPEIEE